MKKYFQFTRFREGLKGFILAMIIIAVGQYYHGHITVREMIITDFMLTLMCIFVSLIVDWVQMWNEKKKNYEEDENIKE